jgi:hypothetical protein
MQATRIERMSLTSLFVAGWVAFFSAAIADAQPLLSRLQWEVHLARSLALTAGG